MAQPKQFNTEPEPVKKPVIVLTGGGSGGHITPLLAVTEEIKKLRPEAKLIFVGQKGDKLADVPRQHRMIDTAYSVRAGKFRRYHGEGLKQLLDLKTFLKNARDFFYVIIGFWQSLKLLKKVKPDVIFIKGGFVGVPVGLAAAIRRIPYITHDSDALPGLANRIISRWAIAHAVALPKNIYKYPAGKTYTVGVPISSNFHNVDKDTQSRYKKLLGLKPSSQVVFVTGGGNGAQRLNEAVVKASAPLLAAYPELFFIHGTGRGHEAAVKQLYKELLQSEDLKRVRVVSFFVDDLYINSGAADIVITRAGATNIAEFAAQHKACIIVPNPMLTGGHQVKNAQYLAEQKAAIVINDAALSANPGLLVDALQELLKSKAKRQVLGKQLAQFAKPRAAKDLAELLLDTIT